MEVALAGLEETGELAMGVWLNPSEVRNFPDWVPFDHNLAESERMKDVDGAKRRNTKG